MQYVLVCGSLHERNWDAWCAMCLMFNIQFDRVDSVDAATQKVIAKDIYDVVWFPSHWVNPSEHPWASKKLVFGPHCFVLPSETKHMGKWIVDTKDANEKTDQKTQGTTQDKTQDNETKLVSTSYKPKKYTNCFYNALSGWVKRAYCEFGTFSMALETIPFGLSDAEFKLSDKPSAIQNISKQRFKIGIYFKRRHEECVSLALKCLRLVYGYGPNDIIIYRYGEYGRGKFYDDCQHHLRYMIWIGQHESQGFAVQEVMSFGVPILAWNITDMYDEIDSNTRKPTYLELQKQGKELKATSLTKWSDACGIVFYLANDLTLCIEAMEERLNSKKSMESKHAKNIDNHTNPNSFDPQSFAKNQFSLTRMHRRWKMAIGKLSTEGSLHNIKKRS